MLSCILMIPHHAPSPDSEHQVLPFRRGKPGPRLRPPPVDDLAEYTRSREPDDYRHRMMVNAAAFLFVLGLIGAGLWIAESVAELRHKEDCVLSGRTNCMPIAVDKGRF